MATTKTGTYTPSTSTTATYGTSSAANKALQTSLNAKGAGLSVDGKYGPATAAAVAKFGATTPTVSSSSSGSSSSSSGGGGPVISDAIKDFNRSMVTGIVGNQSNLVQSTLTEQFNRNRAANEIDETLNNTTGVYSDGYGNNFKTQAEASASYDNKGKTTPLDKKDTPLPEGNVLDSLGNKYFSSMPKGMTYKLPEPTTVGNKWVFDEQGRPFEMDAKGTVKTNLDAEQQYNTNQEKNKEIENQNEIYDQLKANVSAAHQVVIDGIKQKAQIQKTQMEDLNKRYLGAKQVAGFRTGATEYTPEIAMGILKNEEEEGLRRIQEIDDNMTIALAEAVSAKNNDELDVAKQKFDTYSKLQKEKETAIIDQYKMYLDNQKYINDAKKALETEARAKKDQSIQELKSSADGYVKGYASAKDKEGYIQSLSTKLGLDPDIILGEILNATPKPVTPKATTPKVVKQFFTPTASDKSTVAVFASKNPEIDEKKLETDSEYFYWVLAQAKAEADAKKKKSTTSRAS